MKRYLALTLLIAAAAGVIVYLQVCTTPAGCGVWSWAEAKQWAHDNQGLVTLVSMVIAFAGLLVAIFFGLLPYLNKRKRSKRHTAEQLALEHNYLRELIQWFRDEKRDPLSADETEIIELKADIIKPRYRLFAAAAGPQQESPDEGRITDDLVATLLKSKDPIVVLGEPGAGKSVSLSKVMLTLAREGLSQQAPKLPIYLRLGLFTRALTGGGDEMVEFARESLRGLGGHAKRIEKDLDRYLDQGRVVFLLDAMDEMPRGDFDERFEAVKKLNRLTPNKILCACRELDFQEDFPFLRARIQPFDRDRIKRFLRGTLSELGREAFKEILSPANRFRDMAHNPFFLKLLAEFYREYRRLPDSRAELMKVYEEKVFKRAGGRTTFPADLEPEALRAVLARLAYIITTSRRGVTIPSADFVAQFLPVAPSEGECRLKAYENKVEKVLEVAVKERLLHAEPAPLQSGAGGSASGIVLSFHHHRLQEYYTAVYLEEFGAWPDWEGCIDDIWWRETLVMLFGITSSPAERMEALLRYVPARPLLCPDFGAALGHLLARLPTAPHVSYSKRKRWSSSTEIGEALLEMDSSGFYGLHEVAKASENEAAFLNALSEAGVLTNELNPTSEEIESLLELSPEPDGRPLCESARKWLEGHNAVVLDRLELSVECYRNALSKMEGEEVARLASGNFAATLAAFSKDGNILEAVRAIQIAARLPGIDLYSVVEPALMSKDSWCRGEAVAAMAKYPLADDAHRRHTGFIIFLRFLKGDLFYPEPVPFLRSRSEISLPSRLVIAFILLCFVSYLAAFSPFLIYAALWARFDSALSGPEGLLGIGGWVWLAAFGFVVFPIYLAKARLNIPVLRASLLACSICLFLPTITQIVRETPEGKVTSDDPVVRRQENARLTLEIAPELSKATALTGAMIALPQAVEVVGLSVIALVSSFLLGSIRILRAPVIYVKNMGAFSTLLDKLQRWLLIIVGIIFGGMMFQILLSLLLSRSQAGYYFLICALFLFWIGMVIFLLRKSPKDSAERLRMLWEVVTDREEMREVGKFFVKWMTIGLPVLVLLAGVLWVLYKLFGALVASNYLGLALVPAITAIALIIVFLTLKSAPLRELTALYRKGLLGREGGSAPSASGGGDEAWMILSPEKRFEMCREELGRARSGFVRSILYREMAKAYKQMRQERRKIGR